MILKASELRQLDEKFLRTLKETDPDALTDLSLKLATDLKEALERLNQTSSNSSKPSGSFALWERIETSADEPMDDADDLSDDPEAHSGSSPDKA